MSVQHQFSTFLYASHLFTKINMLPYKFLNKKEYQVVSGLLRRKLVYFSDIIKNFSIHLKCSIENKEET